MINKNSSTEQIIAYIGYHGLAGFGIGIIEGILLKGLNSTEGQLRNIAKSALLLSSSAVMLSGVQILVAKLGNIEENEELKYVNKWVVPAAIILPSLLLNRNGASRATQAVTATTMNSTLSQHVRAAARNAQAVRPTIVWTTNVLMGGGELPQALTLKQKASIGIVNYGLMVSITHIVDHFIQ